MATLVLLGLLVVVAPAPPARATPAPLPHAYLPDEEDWHALYMANNRSGDPLEPLRCIPLADDPNRDLTLGGELRFKKHELLQ